MAEKNSVTRAGYGAEVVLANTALLSSSSNMVCYGWMRSLPLADFTPALNHQSEVPLYRQLYERIAIIIRSGNFSRGERLPATRELAGLLGLNRATVSAAYDMLETAGLIAGQVGRGSFVTGQVT